MVEGSPADSVKLAICELLGRPPDLIVSGINAGSNAGINVLYSGTVAAAIEGAFFGITSVAVSLELAEHFDYPHAAENAVRVIERILANNPKPGSLFNVNLPAHSRGEPKGIRVVPMGVGRHGEGFERRQDPRGRTYYWMTYNPPYNLEGPETDVTSLCEGYITVTPLHFDLTRHDQVAGGPRVGLDGLNLPPDLSLGEIPLSRPRSARAARPWTLAATLGALCLVPAACDQPTGSTRPRSVAPTPEPVEAAAQVPTPAPEPVKPRPILGQRTTDIRDASKETTPAAGGVQVQPRVVAKDPITLPGNAYVAIVGQSSILNIQHALDLYQAETGEYPKSFAEFKDRIITANNIALPMLPFYQEYGYDVPTHRLVILEYPDRKVQANYPR